MATNILDILNHAITVGASDVHVVADCPVLVRINGELSAISNVPPINTEGCTEIISQLLTETQKARFEKEWSADTTCTVSEVRFRVNVSLQRQGLEIVFRLIQNHVPTPEELMLPPSVIKLADLKRGLVLVTGPTGSGKSTTLACLLERINQTRRSKIITIEDPIEFVHASKKSFVSQREIGQHTPNFEVALRSILRQDPDVVLLGEMRDYETIAAAIQIADTGHLVLATVHSVDAPQAVERIIDAFSGNQQEQVRAQLGAILRGVVAQTLLPRLDGKGRVAAFEVMINTPAISTMIRQGRTHEIYNAIEMGINEGMRSLSRSLQEMAKAGLIDHSFVPTISPLMRSNSTSK
jgi:twitching motility protein PilT